MTGERFDAGPLVEFAGSGKRDVARMLGVDPSLLCRPLTLNQVDRYCLRLGVHPVEVYGPNAYFGPAADDEIDD